jgi:hypothetical protein
MNSQLRLFFTAAAFFSIVLGVSYHKVSVLAVRKNLPQNTCADLQRVANNALKKKQITFQGFEKLPMQTDVYIQHEKEKCQTTIKMACRVN